MLILHQIKYVTRTIKGTCLDSNVRPLYLVESINFKIKQHELIRRINKQLYLSSDKQVILFKIIIHIHSQLNL